MFRKIKGTSDFLPEQIRCWQKVETHIRHLFTKYHLQEIRTPIIEYQGVFKRAAQHSEMVSKETYSFLDKKKRWLTLRPEGTAGIVRSYVENKLDKTSQLYKFFYCGPCFRYERPQKGRYRQFHQMGVEMLGLSSPFLDIEVVVLAYETLKSLRINNLKVNINSLGDQNSYHNYLKVFQNYLQNKYHHLCSLCQKRMHKNILRIWDCKVCCCKPFLKEAPKMFNYLTKEAKKRFLKVLDGLKMSQVNFEICHNLVRGLDYYTHTVFEIVVVNNDHQEVLGGGGCYDHLVSSFNGDQTPGIGFAFGMERIMLALTQTSFCQPDQCFSLDIFLLFLEPCFFDQAFVLAQTLRHQGFKTDLNYVFLPFTKGLKQAFKTNPRYLLILGEQEFMNEQITIKNNVTKKQATILQKNVVLYLKQQNKECN
ncbi:histidine--tRNA ligase ['Fragaria x ananassa' phyllody phytoplasma]|uniref:Histidine--tRNA ligase n=1 Tax='Fragaria x ananassa' phyllody phytoplasma TaxID=2358428 RepID=A0ABS5K3N8_9MOLU|nr:histidine--tRNA ligase ['Fragaria x ananassa' phyllody phytoplasma]MBS2126507.1 histidine--tRNA ligase ['Fragaria x ananassa' phyllody phytoplasma]